MLKKTIDNPRYPHRVKITRVKADDAINPFKSGEEHEIVLYDGIGRGYTDTTTIGDSKVDSNKRKAIVPVRFDEWKDGLYPMSGDVLEVWKGEWYELQTVRDAEPDNMRTIVYCEFVRN